MGAAGYEKKIAQAKMNLNSLRDDLNRVTTPQLRAFILNQISQKQTQIELLMRKISADAATKAPPVQPLPNKQPPPATKKRLTSAAVV